jgi:hypothetical protein
VALRLMWVGSAVPGAGSYAQTRTGTSVPDFLTHTCTCTSTTLNKCCSRSLLSAATCSALGQFGGTFGATLSGGLALLVHLTLAWIFVPRFVTHTVLAMPSLQSDAISWEPQRSFGMRPVLAKDSATACGLSAC